MGDLPAPPPSPARFERKPELEPSRGRRLFLTIWGGLAIGGLLAFFVWTAPAPATEPVKPSPSAMSTPSLTIAEVRARETLNGTVEDGVFPNFEAAVASWCSQTDEEVEEVYTSVIEIAIENGGTKQEARDVIDALEAYC